MYELNPEAGLLFMHNGKPLSTDRFNRRLKKYCDEIGIPYPFGPPVCQMLRMGALRQAPRDKVYLSSHKIRFTGASMLFDAGVKITDIQSFLGHSNLAMTQHYIDEQICTSFFKRKKLQIPCYYKGLKPLLPMPATGIEPVRSVRIAGF